MVADDLDEGMKPGGLSIGPSSFAQNSLCPKFKRQLEIRGHLVNSVQNQLIPRSTKRKQCQPLFRNFLVPNELQFCLARFQWRAMFEVAFHLYNDVRLRGYQQVVS
jgi:hypothetical protein